MSALGTWEVTLYDISGNYVATLPFEGITIDKILNDITVVSVRVNYKILSDLLAVYGSTVHSLLTSGFRSVKITRDATTMFKGILTEASIDKFEYDINISLTFKSWLAYFERRFITKAYTSDDAGEIAWDMINTAQAVTNGNIGITKGTVTATKDRDRTFDRDEIAKRIIDMGSQNILDGYEFEITDDKVFTVNSRLGSDKPAVVFDERVIRSFTITYENGLSLTTQAHSLGSGVGVDQLEETYTASSTYLNKWYLLEAYDNSISVVETATLQDHAQKYVETHRDASYRVKLKTNGVLVPITDYDVGDGVQVTIPNIVSALLRIRKKTIMVDANDEQVQLEFI